MNTETESSSRPLRVAVVSAVFPPEFTYSSRTSGNVAEQLAAEGQVVTVYASFPSKPAGQLFPGVRRKLYATTSERGYKLIRCFSFLAPESTILSRFTENISFGLTSAFRLLLDAKPDVIYSNTWPIFATAMVAAVAASSIMIWFTFTRIKKQIDLAARPLGPPWTTDQKLATLAALLSLKSSPTEKPRVRKT